MRIGRKNEWRAKEMLQEVRDLQNNAVARLVEKMSRRSGITFRAPTGSGKTHMMDDMMNPIVEEFEYAVANHEPLF